MRFIHISKSLIYIRRNWIVWTNFGHDFHIQNKKNVNINVCPEAFYLWVVAERILCKHQQQFTNNMWTWIAGDCLIGPHLHDIDVQANITKNSSYVICQSYRKLYYWQPQHECGTCVMAHNSSLSVRDVLSNTCHNRWTGRGGPTARPPRSPDFNPLDFYLREHIKLPVYAAPVDNEVAHRIAEACQTIRNCSGIFARMRRSMMRRVEACIESHGGHFEHLL
jgi:hypothetical protein